MQPLISVGPARSPIYFIRFEVKKQAPSHAECRFILRLGTNRCRAAAAAYCLLEFSLELAFFRFKRSLQIKNNKYYIVLNNYVNGKRKQKWVKTELSAKGNKRKAEQLLREVLQQQEQQSGIVRSDVTFADYVRVWLSQVKRRVDEVTYQGYELLGLQWDSSDFDRNTLTICFMASLSKPTVLSALDISAFSRFISWLSS